MASFLRLHSCTRDGRDGTIAFFCGATSLHALAGTAKRPGLAQGRVPHGWHQHGKEPSHGEHDRQDGPVRTTLSPAEK